MIQQDVGLKPVGVQNANQTTKVEVALVTGIPMKAYTENLVIGVGYMASMSMPYVLQVLQNVIEFLVVSGFSKFMILLKIALHTVDLLHGIDSSTTIIGLETSNYCTDQRIVGRGAEW